VPLIGVRRAVAETPGNAFYPPGLTFPVTAFFRFEGSLADLKRRQAGRLELYNPLALQAVAVRNQTVVYALSKLLHNLS
jgi:hypothetical protein